MKCVLKQSHAFACGCLKDLLEAEGIECVLTGEQGIFTGAEGVPIADGLDPWLTEVWVNDQDVVKASGIAEEFVKSSAEEQKE